MRTRVQKPEENLQVFEEMVAVDRNVVEVVEGKTIHEGRVEINDAVLAERIVENRQLLDKVRKSNVDLKLELRSMEQNLGKDSTREYNTLMRQLAQKLAQRSEVESRLKIMERDSKRLIETSMNKADLTRLEVRKIAPVVWELRRKLERVLHENRNLVSQARVHSIR